MRALLTNRKPLVEISRESYEHDRTAFLTTVVFGESHIDLVNSKNTIVEMRVIFKEGPKLLIKASAENWMHVLGVEYFLALAFYITHNRGTLVHGTIMRLIGHPWKAIHYGDAVNFRTLELLDSTLNLGLKSFYDAAYPLC
jgi:hypothetical protein